MSRETDNQPDVPQLIKAIRAVQEYSGMGIRQCRDALAACDNDPLLACGYLFYDGSLINLKGQDKEAWLLRQAKGYAQSLMLDSDGRIRRASSPTSPRPGLKLR